MEILFVKNVIAGVEMLNLIGLKTNLGYYISIVRRNYYDSTSLELYFFNGKSPRPTFDKNWVFVEECPTIIERKKSQPNINYRYELIDPKLESENIPAELSFDVSEVDEDGDTVWKKEYSHLSSLYRLQSDKQPDKIEPVEFKLDIILELNINQIDDPSNFSFSYPIELKYDRYRDNRIGYITEKDVQHQELDKILFPSILIHKTPAMLTSKQVYNIVRQHIKEHIDLRYAKINSDYDFCFSVDKILNLSSPYSYQVEEKSGRRKYSKTIYVNTKAVKVFEMTNSEDNYKGYTPIKPIIGNDEADLKEKVDAFLYDIMTTINEPLVECKTCNGYGAVLENKK